MISRVLAVAAVLSVVAVGGCEGAGPEPNTRAPSAGITSPDVPAAKGQRISTIEYSYSAPEGWVDDTGRNSEFDTAVGSLDKKDGFTDVATVKRIVPAFSEDPAEIAEAMAGALRGEKRYRDIKISPRQSVDGAPTTGLTSATQKSGVDQFLLQFALLHDDKFFIVTFSFTTTLSADAQYETAQSVLASWRWAS